MSALVLQATCTHVLTRKSQSQAWALKSLSCFEIVGLTLRDRFWLCLSICPSVSLSLSLSLSLVSVSCLCLCLRVCLSVSASVSLPLCLCLCLSASALSLRLFLYLRLCLSVFVSGGVSISLSACLYLSVSASVPCLLSLSLRGYIRLLPLCRSLFPCLPPPPLSCCVCVVCAVSRLGGGVLVRACDLRAAEGSSPSRPVSFCFWSPVTC